VLVQTEDFAATAIKIERKAEVAPTAAVDIDLEMGESVFAPAHVPVPKAQVLQHADAQPSTTGTLRSINTKEMLDVRQQAEFFMTLGQYDDGVTLLESSIKASAESNPLVYLDLLKALHTLSRKMAFEAYRAEFNHVFTGIVPPYALFNQGSRGLDAYPDICQQIVALWPTDAAIQFMESCMVREPGDAPDRGFDLDAFRELLLLHAVAKRLPSGMESGMVPFSAVRATSVGSVPRFDGTDSMPVAAMPPEDGPSSALIDLDLSEPHPDNNLIDFDLSDYDLGGDKSSKSGS
jgi:pilus assembly protein FimV